MASKTLKPVSAALSLDSAAIQLSDVFKAGDGAAMKAAAIMRDAFSGWKDSQPTGEAGAKAYSTLRETCEKLYVGDSDGEARKTAKNAFKTHWSRTLRIAGIRPVNAKGEVSTQGAGGGKPKAAEKSEEAAKPQPATQRDLITALFGHCDDGLMEAMLYATAHELLFVQWAKASAAAMNK